MKRKGGARERKKCKQKRIFKEKKKKYSRKSDMKTQHKNNNKNPVKNERRQDRIKKTEGAKANKKGK